MRQAKLSMVNNMRIPKDDQILKINTLEILMEQNQKDHESIKSMILAFGDKLDESLERMEKKFAPIWVKDVIVWGGGIIGTSLLLYVIQELFIS